MGTEVDLLLADAANALLTLDDGTALLVDWYQFNPYPEAFIEVRVGRTWIPIQCDVRSFRSSVGRDLTTESVEAGIAEIHISNRGGQYTRFYDLEPALSENTEVRLRVRHPTTSGVGVEAVAWHGWVIEWEQDWEFGDDAVVIHAADAVSLLAEQGGALGWTVGFLNDSPAERLLGLVNRVGLHDIRCYFERGDVALINPSVGSTTVLQEAFTTAQSDGGRFFAECDRDGFYFVYLDRKRFERPPISIPPAFSARQFASGQDAKARAWGYPRRAQPNVPLFGDWCTWDRSPLPYSDLRWSYRGWEVASVVAVTNTAPIVDRDANGNELPTPWNEVGAIVVTGAKHHNVVEYAQLRFSTQAEAVTLAGLYGNVLDGPQIDVTEMVIYPELDERLWDYTDTLRQGDWVKVERHLQTHRFVITACIEGIRWELTPHESGGQPRWKITYRLHSLYVDVQERPAQEIADRPFGFPDLAPPLPQPTPPIDLAPFGGGSTFTERGVPPFRFDLQITDPDHVEHQALAYNPDFGAINLPLLADGVFVGDVVTRTFGGATLAPGVWYVWVRERADPLRTSNQMYVEIPPWGDIHIPDGGLAWNPDDYSIVTYTDARYPPLKQEVWMRGRNGSFSVVVAPEDWQQTGPTTFTARFYTGYGFPGTDIQGAPWGVMPDEYEIWVQDSDDYRRKSNPVTAIKPTPVPQNVRLFPTTAQPWEREQWEDIYLIWDTVATADRYTVEYRVSATFDEIQAGEEPYSDVRSTTTKVNAANLPGGYIQDDVQRQRTYQFRVSATVNTQESEFSNWQQCETGFPYFIRRSYYSQHSGYVIAARNVVMGVTIPQPEKPYWCQNVNPNEDLFVGVVIDRVAFTDLRARGIDSRGRFIEHKNLLWGGSDPNNRKVDNVQVVINGGWFETVPSNPELPYTGTMNIDQWGPGVVGIVPTGLWYGTSPPVPPTRDSWIEGALEAQGDMYEYFAPLQPRLI